MKRQEVFHTLNLVRGLAAVAVVIFHMPGIFKSQWAPSGYLAVDLFFVLSGVVIAHAYETRLLAGMTVMNFVILRLVRFYPLYFAGLLLGGGVIMLDLVFSPPAGMTAGGLAMGAILGLFFIPAIIDLDMFPLNVPAWSLFFELLVNVLYASLVRVLNNRCLITIAIFFLGILSFLIIDHGNANLGAHLFDFLAGLSRTVFSFSAGVLLYRYRSVLPSRVPVACAVLPCIIFFIPVEPTLRPAFDIGCIAFLFPLAVATGLRSAPRLEATGNVLGDLSFALYAVHYPVIQLGLTVIRRLELPPIAFGFAILAALIIASWVLHRFYDIPARSWLSRKLRPDPT